MEVQQLYDLIEANLDNGILNPQDKMGKLRRVKLPIPEEYGGGFVTGYGYENAARNLIDRALKQIKMEVKSPNFGSCYEKWLELKEGQAKSPSTIGMYKWIGERYLLPFFGEMPIVSISPDDIQKYFNSIMNYSKSISTQSKAVLSGVFDRAARLGEIDQNIMLYKYERSHKEREKKVLQDEDLLSVISEINNLSGNDYLYFCFLCFTSLRRGEILGLKWKDIDDNVIHVRRNVTFPNGQNDPVIREPKDGSFGNVHLNSELIFRLSGKRGLDDAFVIPYSEVEYGRPITRSMFMKMWNRISKTIDLKGATSHSFRASYVTMMNAHCDHVDPKTLQSALRHKTPDLAIKVYTKENTNKTKLAEEEYDKWLSNALETRL